MHQSKFLWTWLTILLLSFVGCSSDSASSDPSAVRAHREPVGSRPRSQREMLMTSQAKFPKRRDDGSVSVAARFAFDTPTAVDAAKSTVRTWIMQRTADGIVLGEDLTKEPCVVVHGADTFDVVFDGRAGSHWKDWMIALTQEIVSEIPNATFRCFYDLVGDVAHPASRVPE